MAKRATRRGRARKPRAARPRPRAEDQPRRSTSPPVAAGGGTSALERGGVGERPQAPWHPLPLSELLILVGAIAAVIGYSRGSSGHAALLAGILAVGIGTIEVTLREHLSGYRSHTIILALLPTLAFHSVVVLLLAAFTTVPKELNIGLLLLDAALFAFLFRVLRARFQSARGARLLAANR